MQIVGGVEAPAATEEERAAQLRENQVIESTIQSLRTAPDVKFALGLSVGAKLLETYLWSFQGLATADFPRYGRKFWEIYALPPDWVYKNSQFPSSEEYAGLKHVLYWQNGCGALVNSPTDRKSTRLNYSH